MDNQENQQACEIIRIKPISTLTNVNKDWQTATTSYWELVAQIFDKNVNKSKAKIKAPRAIIKALEPWAVALEAEWDLVVRCFGFEGINTPYRNALEWFSGIQAEAKQADLYSINSSSGKQDDYTEMKLVLDAIESGRNPFQGNAHLQHNYRLIESALKWAQLSEGFRNQYLRPYIKAYRAWNTAISKNSNIRSAFEQDGQLRARVGRGKGSVAISSSSYQ